MTENGVLSNFGRPSEGGIELAEKTTHGKECFSSPILLSEVLAMASNQSDKANDHPQ